MKSLLGQGSVLHAFDFSVPCCRGQVFPPLDGAGLLQALFWVCFPPPHVAEHTDHAFHSPHFPLTNIIIAKVVTLRGIYRILLYL